MAESLRAPRGTRDIIDLDAEAFSQIEAAARSLFAHYGYRRIETPIFEARELFERSVGEETDIVSKEMYVFEDRKGRPYALRPEGTAGVVRAFNELSLADRGVVKLWYGGPMFRYERPQAGRFRQFFQLGCEMFGAKSGAADLETIELAVRLMEKLGVEAHLRVNHLGCVSCKKTYADSLRAFFQERRNSFCPDCQRRAEKNPLRVLDCKVPSCGELRRGAPALSLCESCRAEYDALRLGLETFRIDFHQVPSLVRGLDYYTGVVFEMVSSALGAQDAILGGGRYDGLVAELGGRPTPAFGFALGMDRLAMILRKRWEEKPDAERGEGPLIYVIGLGETARLHAAFFTRTLRRVFESRTLTEGTRPVWIEEDLPGRSLKAALRTADKLGARYAAILGEDELRDGTVVLRDMSRGNQATVAVKGMDESFLERGILQAVEALRQEGNR